MRGVGELITDQDEMVARAAQHILQEIGAPALPFIWIAHGDTSNRARREAAMNIFHTMPTEEIKDALVDLLTSDQPGDIAMAQALLLERIHDEETLPAANQEMIPALIQYVQIHEKERTSLRVMALLFLHGGDSVIRHLVQVLYDYPEHYEQLVHAFLFLGDEAIIALLNILNDPHAPMSLRAEAMAGRSRRRNCRNGQHGWRARLVAVDDDPAERPDARRLVEGGCARRRRQQRGLLKRDRDVEQQGGEHDSMLGTS